MAAFLGGYALIWTMFGWAAFVGDAVLHNIVDRTPWLAAHPWLIARGVLAGAGAFQFTALKDRRAGVTCDGAAPVGAPARHVTSGSSSLRSATAWKAASGMRRFLCGAG